MFLHLLQFSYIVLFFFNFCISASSYFSASSHFLSFAIEAEKFLSVNSYFTSLISNKAFPFVAVTFKVCDVGLFLRLAVSNLFSKINIWNIIAQGYDQITKGCVVKTLYQRMDVKFFTS